MQQRSSVLEANLANVLIAELSREETSQHARVSAPYERVDIVEVPAEDLRRTRRRAATISRDDLALRAKARAEVFDGACTMRFSAPYVRIEIEQQMPRALLTTGTFESAWFVAPDDAPQEEVVHAEPSASRWIWIVAAMLASCAVAVLAITS
jgi:hypothetical protein